jgi:hypothetical protein
MRSRTLIRVVLLAALVACVPLQSAFAYIDPNSAGSLYQLLFPLLIAIGGAFAALRRIIVHAVSRLASAVIAAVRGERARG